MIRYIKNSDIETDEFKKLRKDYLDTINQTDFSFEENPIHFHRQIQYPFCYKYSNLRGDERILDAGCGYTSWPYFLEKKNPKLDICLSDEDFVPLKKFPARFKTFEEGTEFMTFQDKSFDIIYSISTLEHTYQWQKTILNFNRVIKDGGKLIMDIEVGEGYFTRENIKILIDLLKQRFFIDSIDLNEDDGWILLNQNNIKMLALTCILYAN